MPKTKRKAGGSTLDKIRAALTRKLGPAPAWAYLILFALGVYYWRRKHAGSSTAGPSTTLPADRTAQNVQPVYVVGSAPNYTGSGSGTGTDGGPPPTGNPPPGGGPPPPSSVTIWIHGNPGHTYTYTGDPSKSAWFQLDGQWYYYAAGDSQKYAGSAYAANDPYLYQRHPDAGQPPGGSQGPSQGPQAPVQSQTSTGDTVTSDTPVSAVLARVAPHARVAGVGYVIGGGQRPSIFRRVVTRNVDGRPVGKRPPHWTPPPFRWRDGNPGPEPKSPAEASSTIVQRDRPSTTAIGRPRPLPAYSHSQVPSTPDARDQRQVAAPAARRAGEQLAGALDRSAARSARAQTAGPGASPTTGRQRSVSSGGRAIRPRSGGPSSTPPAAAQRTSSPPARQGA